MALEAQDNPFPSVLFRETVDPATPAANDGRLWLDTDGILKWIDDAGVVSNIALGSPLTDPMTTRGDIIIRNASNVTARLGRGTAAQVLTSDGTDVAWAAAAAGGGLLAVKSHRNGTDTATYTTTSATFVDVDGTNLEIVFTAPASGNVLVRLTALLQQSGGGSPNVQFAMYESGSIVGAGGISLAIPTSSPTLCSLGLYLTGLSVASHTMRWRWDVTTGTATIYTGPIFGPALMEVLAAP